MAKREREDQPAIRGSDLVSESLSKVLDAVHDMRERQDRLEVQVQAVVEAQLRLTVDLGKTVRQVERRIGALDLQQLS